MHTDIVTSCRSYQSTPSSVWCDADITWFYSCKQYWRRRRVIQSFGVFFLFDILAWLLLIILGDWICQWLWSSNHSRGYATFQAHPSVHCDDITFVSRCKTFQTRRGWSQHGLIWGQRGSVPVGPPWIRAEVCMPSSMDRSRGILVAWLGWHSCLQS